MSVVDIGPGLRAHLIADATVGPLIDSGASEQARYRIFPILLRQGEVRDSIVYHRISGQGDRHMQGPSGITRPRIQIDCWSQDADAAASLARAVKASLDGFKGTVAYGSNSPQDSVEVLGVFFDSERDDYDADGKLYLVSHDYLIWFRES